LPQQNVQPAQAVRVNADLQNLPTLIPAGAAAKISVSGAPPLAQNQSAQTNFQASANLPPSPVETFAHSAAKSAAIGAATFKFHDNAPSNAANLPSPSPVTAATARTQSQDNSNGSSGNDANAKTDHPSIASNAPADAKGFVQSLSAAAPAPPAEHPVAADANAVAAAVPIQPQSANTGGQAGAPSGVDPKPAESLPVAAQSAPVVSAAHMVTQPGQTEIRIEMQADSLGGVELRAHIAGDQIGASIAVEHHDIQTALALDLPALHSALAEKNLRVETLTVSQGNFSSLSGGPNHENGQRNFMQSPAKFAYLEQPETAQAFMETPAEWAASASSNAGLSVVA
jgi:flagellar hook-length control protein FliK